MSESDEEDSDHAYFNIRDFFRRRLRDDEAEYFDAIEHALADHLRELETNGRGALLGNVRRQFDQGDGGNRRQYFPPVADLSDDDEEEEEGEVEESVEGTEDEDADDGEVMVDAIGQSPGGGDNQGDRVVPVNLDADENAQQEFINVRSPRRLVSPPAEVSRSSHSDSSHFAATSASLTGHSVTMSQATCTASSQEVRVTAATASLLLSATQPPTAMLRSPRPGTPVLQPLHSANSPTLHDSDSNSYGTPDPPSTPELASSSDLATTSELSTPELEPASKFVSISELASGPAVSPNLPECSPDQKAVELKINEEQSNDSERTIDYFSATIEEHATEDHNAFYECEGNENSNDHQMENNDVNFYECEGSTENISNHFNIEDIPKPSSPNPLSYAVSDGFETPPTVSDNEEIYEECHVNKQDPSGDAHFSDPQQLGCPYVRSSPVHYSIQNENRDILGIDEQSNQNNGHFDGDPEENEEHPVQNAERLEQNTETENNESHEDITLYNGSHQENALLENVECDGNIDCHQENTHHVDKDERNGENIERTELTSPDELYDTASSSPAEYHEHFQPQFTESFSILDPLSSAVPPEIPVSAMTSSSQSLIILDRPVFGTPGTSARIDPETIQNKCIVTNSLGYDEVPTIEFRQNSTTDQVQDTNPDTLELPRYEQVFGNPQMPDYLQNTRWVEISSAFQDPSSPLAPNILENPVIPQTPGVCYDSAPLQPHNMFQGTSSPLSPSPWENPGTPPTPDIFYDPATLHPPIAFQDPRSPLTPSKDNPGTPPTPDSFENPGTPPTPDTLQNPGTPSTPGTLQTPGTPSTLDTLENPGTPPPPDTLQTPGTLPIPDTLQNPGTPPVLDICHSPGTSQTNYAQTLDTPLMPNNLSLGISPSSTLQGACTASNPDLSSYICLSPIPDMLIPQSPGVQQAALPGISSANPILLNPPDSPPGPDIFADLMTSEHRGPVEESGVPGTPPHVYQALPQYPGYPQPQQERYFSPEQSPDFPATPDYSASPDYPATPEHISTPEPMSDDDDDDSMEEALGIAAEQALYEEARFEEMYNEARLAAEQGEQEHLLDIDDPEVALRQNELQENQNDDNINYILVEPVRAQPDGQEQRQHQQQPQQQQQRQPEEDNDNDEGYIGEDEANIEQIAANIELPHGVIEQDGQFQVILNGEVINAENWQQWIESRVNNQAAQNDVIELQMPPQRDNNNEGAVANRGGFIQNVVDENGNILYTIYGINLGDDGQVVQGVYAHPNPTADDIDGDDELSDEGPVVGPLYTLSRDIICNVLDSSLTRLNVPAIEPGPSEPEPEEDRIDWSLLPMNIVTEIMRYLSDADRVRMAKTCKKWHSLLNSACLWRIRIIRFHGSGTKAKAEAKRLKGWATCHGNWIQRLSIYCDHPSYVVCRTFQKAMTDFFGTLLWQKASLKRFCMRRLYVERYWRYDTVRERLVGSLSRFFKRQNHLQYIDLSDGHWGLLNGLKILEALAQGSKGNRRLATLNLEDFFSSRLSLFRLQRYQNVLTKFKGLTEFFTNYSCLSEEILDTLVKNCEGRLKMLSVKIYRTEPHTHVITPVTWRLSARLCPRLRVEVYIEGMGNFDDIGGILSKDMPLRMLQIWTGIHPVDQNWRTDRLFQHVATNYATTLEEAYMSVEPEGESVDTAVVEMLEKCKLLDSMDLQTTLEVDTLETIYQKVNDNKILATRLHINLNNLTGVEMEVLDVINERWAPMVEERQLNYVFEANELVLF